MWVHLHNYLFITELQRKMIQLWDLYIYLEVNLNTHTHNLWLYLTLVLFKTANIQCFSCATYISLHLPWKNRTLQFRDRSFVSEVKFLFHGGRGCGYLLEFRVAGLMPCYHSIVPCTCRTDISVIAICHLWRFILIVWYVGRSK